MTITTGFINKRYSYELLSDTIQLKYRCRIIRILLLISLLTIPGHLIFSQARPKKVQNVSPEGSVKPNNEKKLLFVHPGLLQTKQDLDLLKEIILAGRQPWTKAFDKVKGATSLGFIPRAVTHVTRSTGGQLSAGGYELQASARQAYASALIWYITGDKNYAENAISILNQWSGKLWDFEGNDAKLLAAWTGHVFANAAEILKYTNSGWKQADMDQFRKMLLTVYYPLLRNFFPEANGNWDGAIINTLMCIGIFCDRHDIFDSAVRHFRYGERNGGITKYVYPTGQCEESTRDQGHVQLGLGEFAEACQVAWTQGVDLYAEAGNRLALGVEYTAKYMAGENVPVYGTISDDGRGRYSNVYEAIYQHYNTVKGLEMPYTKRAVDSTRAKAGIELLSSIRATAIKNTRSNSLVKITSSISNGATGQPIGALPADAIIVLPGQSIQAALDKAENSNGWVVLGRGIHRIAEPLRLRSGLTLAGEGKESILFLDPRTSAEVGYAAITNGNDSLQDVVLRDFVIDGAGKVVTLKDPNHDRRLRASQLAQTRAGIILLSRSGSQMHNIELKNITVQHNTHNGVVMKGVNGFKIIDCDFSDNGGSVAPGWGCLHNLSLEYVQDGEIRSSRFDDSPWGCGIDIKMGTKILITGNELARNYLHGISISDSKEITVEENLVESNDAGGISLNKLFKENYQIVIKKNTLQYNGQEIK